MVVAGSEVPKITDTRDLAGTCVARLRRHQPTAAAALVVLSGLFLQGCGLSEPKGVVAEPERAVARASLAGGETIIPRGSRTANAMGNRDSFEDRYPRDTFSDRYSAILGYAPEPPRDIIFVPKPVREMAFLP